MGNWKTYNKKIPNVKKLEKNEMTGEYRVKMSFRFKDSSGNVKRTDTNWCIDETIEGAVNKAFADKERLIKEKKREARDGYKKAKENKKKKTLGDCLQEYREELLELSNNPKKKRTTYKSLYDDVGSIIKSHTPDGLLETPISDIESVDFGKWIKYINSDSPKHKGLAGRTVKRYKSALSAINRWLYETGYYKDEALVDLVGIRLKNYKTKALSEGEKTDRYCLGIEDLEKIKRYYTSQGLGTFYNYYYYTLWQILFFTGMRIEELVALQFKNIDFDAGNGNGEIAIMNAITQRENRREAVERTLREEYRTKNGESRRYITMFGVYRQLLKDYKEDAYIYQFPDVDDLDNAFVFPNIQAKNDEEQMWNAVHKNLLRELNKVCIACGIPKTDCQMFRHSCVTFLLKEMKYSEEDIFNYFGHTDTEMIHKIYSELTLRDKMQKANVTMNQLITNDDLAAVYNAEKTKAVKKVEVGDKQNEAIVWAKFYRIQDQILKAISRNQKIYYYRSSDEEIIERITQGMPSLVKRIKLVAKKD